jgi:hypothetical protein
MWHNHFTLGIAFTDQHETSNGGDNLASASVLRRVLPLRPNSHFILCSVPKFSLLASSYRRAHLEYLAEVPKDTDSTLDDRPDRADVFREEKYFTNEPLYPV